MENEKNKLACFAIPIQKHVFILHDQVRCYRSSELAINISSLAEYVSNDITFFTNGETSDLFD